MMLQKVTAASVGLRQILEKAKGIVDRCDLYPEVGDCLEISVALALIARESAGAGHDIEVTALVRYTEPEVLSDLVHASLMIGDRFYGFAPDSDDLESSCDNLQRYDKDNDNRHFEYEIAGFSIEQLMAEQGKSLETMFSGFTKNYDCSKPVFSWAGALAMKDRIQSAFAELNSTKQSHSTSQEAPIMSEQNSEQNTEMRDFHVIGMYDEGRVFASRITAQAGFDAMYLAARAEDFDSELSLIAATEISPAPGQVAQISFPSDDSNSAVYASDLEQHAEEMDERYPREMSARPGA